MEDPWVSSKAAIDQYNATNRSVIIPFLVGLDREMRKQGLSKYVRDRILVNLHEGLFMQKSE